MFFENCANFAEYPEFRGFIIDEARVRQMFNTIYRNSSLNL